MHPLASEFDASPARARTDVPQPRIVLAEDDAAFRQLLAAMLRRMGYALLEAGSGAELLTIIQSHFYSRALTPELVVADVRMPGFSGLEVLEWLRGADLFTPVILMTGFGSRELHQRARELRVSYLLDKPFDLSELRACVTAAAPLP